MINEMQTLKLDVPGKFTRIRCPVPEIAKNDVLIKFKYAMLCGSDYPKFNGSCPDITCPLPIGMPIHECVGEIVASNSTFYNTGDMVLAMPKSDAGLSDYFIANVEKIIKLDGWSEEDLKYAPLSQPVGTILNAIDKIGNIENKKILIFGLGGIGQIFCTILKLRGATDVTAIEPNKFRCAVANDKLNIKSTIQWEVSLSNQFDLVIDAVGQNSQENIINNSILSVKHHGKVILFGIPTIKDQRINIYHLIRKNLSLVGVINPFWEKYLREGVTMVQSNLDLFRSLLTHEFPLSQAESAFKFFGQKDTNRIKILLFNNFN